MDHFSGSTTTTPLLALVATVDDQLQQARALSPTFLTVPEKRDLLLALAAIQRQVDGLLVETLAVSADVADEAGFRSAGSWLATQTHDDRATLGRTQKLADATVKHPLVLAGLRSGAVTLRQGEAITKALDDLGAEVSPAIKIEAEERLVAFAAEFDPSELRRLGAAILELIDPDTFADHERQRLEDELRKARAATRLTIRSRGDGTSRISGIIPDHIAARLRTYLSAFSSPRHDAASSGAANGAAPTTAADARAEGTSAEGSTDPNAGKGPVIDSRYLDPVTGKRLPGERVLGEALCAFLEAADPARMPLQGGAATSIIITIGLDQLHDNTGTATTGTQRLTPGEVRRLACQANLIPAVLGTRSHVLDLGRTSRLFNPPQRKALALRWPICAIDGCPVPAEQCEAHHLRPWSHGGPTNLDDGVLLCPRHHHLTHDDRYEMTRTPTGQIQLHRRC